MTMNLESELTTLHEPHDGVELMTATQSRLRMICAET